MLFLKKRRLITWLITAYLKRWGKSIFLFFGVGLLVFLIVVLNLSFIESKLPFSTNTSIGLVGSYPSDKLPQVILNRVSIGLTKVAEDGSINPGAAKSWQIKDGGKTYVFYLYDNLRFTDGKKLDSYSINYNFSDVKVEKPDQYTIIFKLKDVYAPFLVTVSENKILKNNFIGIGPYKITDIKVNGGFIQSTEIQSVKNPKEIYTYKFTDTQDGVKTSFVLGEINQADGINNLSYNNLNLKDFNNLTVKQNVDYGKLVTLFYNNQDNILSDKRVRKALAYSLPSDFIQGQNNYTPFSPKLWASEPITNPYIQDFDHSKLLLESASQSAGLKLVIKTLPQYRKVAQEISASWKKAGVDSQVEVVDFVPDNFQIFLGDILMLKDPDQYALWHTGQPSNISNYRNLRIDKLLEDGRKTIDTAERKRIYANFQKYLLDDAPASFLFFPYNYQINRK